MAIANYPAKTNTPPTRPSESDDLAIADSLCPLCKGAGWSVLPLKQDNSNAATDRLIRCPCMAGEDRRTRWLKARAMSDMEPDMDSMTFGMFRQNKAPEGHRAALAFATDPRQWLTLVGGPGRGKTHLLAAIANRLLAQPESNRWPVYCVVPRLLQRLRAAYGDTGTGGSAGLRDDARHYLDRLIESDVLLLDDIGAEHETSWGREQLYVLLDTRYRAHRPTAIATNLLPHQMPDRIASRLQDVARSVLVVMTGDDYRQSPERQQEGQ